MIVPTQEELAAGQQLIDDSVDWWKADEDNVEEFLNSEDIREASIAIVGEAEPVFLSTLNLYPDEAVQLLKRMLILGMYLGLKRYQKTAVVGDDGLGS